MLTKLLRRQPPSTKTVKKLKSNYLVSSPGKKLLKSEDRQRLLKKIKRLFSVTEEVWNEHYFYAIQKFAEISQALPASEIHHHSKDGGLIDHTLETVFNGIRISQGYILPPNSEAEKISAASDRWRFGVFIALLSHDLGKVVTDIEVVFREKEDETFSKWHPWTGIIPFGSEYTFRYRDRLAISRIDKHLHEKAAMSMLPDLLTDKATQWLFDDYELISQIFNTVSHTTFGGGTIAEIVRKADMSSVRDNLGANTGVNSNYSASIPLHEKLMTSLRYLIQDGELKRNKPGAALWVCDEETWVVSKPAIGAAQSKLLNEGHKGIPKNVVRLYENLREHGLLITTPEGQSVWTALVDDPEANWTQKLTFLRFRNEVIWPNKSPDIFTGSITPLDRSGNPILEDEVDDKNSESNDVEKGSIEAIKQSQKNDTQKLATDEKKTEVTTPPKNCANTKYKSLPKHDFLDWLIKGIKTRKIRVNETKAHVHIVDNYVALISPTIFYSFFKERAFKASTYKERGQGSEYIYIQKELEALKINTKSEKGENIHELLVTGKKKQSYLKAYLIDRKYFPTLSNFSHNKAITIASKMKTN